MPITRKPRSWEKAESKMGGKSEEKTKEKSKAKDGRTGKSRSTSPNEKQPSKGPPGPPDDNGYPPSLRGSTYDDNMSQSNVTIADIPRQRG